MEFEWETLQSKDSNHDGCNTIIGKVPGGWVLRHMYWNDVHETQSESMVFIPDRDHKWII